MSFLAAIMECVTGTGTPSSSVRTSLPSPNQQLVDEKQHQPHPTQTDADLAAEILTILRTAEKTGPSLQHRLQSAIGTTRSSSSWTESLARAVLDGVVDLVQEGREKMGPAMAEALRRVEDEADRAFGYGKDHPRRVIAGLVIIVAVGILVVMMAPWVVEALGFAELGPVEGSFAAWWESLYGGFIPKGSLFSYLQRLGMTWK
ncbi:hypothetical protein GE09DRAFT_1257226 [Coniochaeta sp. 2T2.1]|nr:hypothetical protein GE09DRAFT_1257226 [Coniochaeta sp. 2T2.1]